MRNFNSVALKTVTSSTHPEFYESTMDSHSDVVGEVQALLAASLEVGPATLRGAFNHCITAIVSNTLEEIIFSSLVRRYPTLTPAESEVIFNCASFYFVHHKIEGGCPLDRPDVSSSFVHVNLNTGLGVVWVAVYE